MHVLGMVKVGLHPDAAGAVHDPVVAEEADAVVEARRQQVRQHLGLGRVQHLREPLEVVDRDVGPGIRNVEL